MSNTRIELDKDIPTVSRCVAPALLSFLRRFLQPVGTWSAAEISNIRYDQRGAFLVKFCYPKFPSAWIREPGISRMLAAAVSRNETGTLPDHICFVTEGPEEMPTHVYLWEFWHSIGGVDGPDPCLPGLGHYIVQCHPLKGGEWKS